MTATTDERDRHTIERDAAIEAVLTIVPPGLGGREQAIFNLRTLPHDHLLRLQADLQASADRIGPAEVREISDASRERLEEAQTKIRSGLDRLKAAAESIRASRTPPDERRSGEV